jgi:hypothetical protein
LTPGGCRSEGRRSTPASPGGVHADDPRREFLRRSLLVPFALGVGGPPAGGLFSLLARPGGARRDAAASTLLHGPGHGPDVHRFRVGALDCVAVSDGIRPYPAHMFFVNAPEAELREELAAVGDGRETVTSSYNCLAIRAGDEWAVVDTGIGPVDPSLGQLLPRLREADIPPEEIGTVVLTHGHPDHIGGLTDAEGNLNFPNARYILWRDEWEFWTSDERLAELPEVMASFARKNLPPIAERVELLEREAEILPGVQAFPTPGHTPGHMSLSLASQGERSGCSGTRSSIPCTSGSSSGTRRSTWTRRPPVGPGAACSSAPRRKAPTCTASTSIRHRASERWSPTRTGGDGHRRPRSAGPYPAPPGVPSPTDQLDPPLIAQRPHRSPDRRPADPGARPRDILVPECLGQAPDRGGDHFLLRSSPRRNGAHVIVQPPIGREHGNAEEVFPPGEQ